MRICYVSLHGHDLRQAPVAEKGYYLHNGSKMMLNGL